MRSVAVSDLCVFVRKSALRALKGPSRWAASCTRRWSGPSAEDRGTHCADTGADRPAVIHGYEKSLWLSPELQPAVAADVEHALPQRKYAAAGPAEAQPGGTIWFGVSRQPRDNEGYDRRAFACLVDVEAVGPALLGVLVAVVAERVEVVGVGDALDGHEADVPGLVLCAQVGIGRLTVSDGWGNADGTAYRSSCHSGR